MEPALPLNEQERRLAMCQTSICERRPLVNAGRNENDSTEHLASTRHLRVEQGRAIKGPLCRGGNEREADPDQKISCGEPTSRRKRLASRRCLPANPRITGSSCRPSSPPTSQTHRRSR